MASNCDDGTIGSDALEAAPKAAIPPNLRGAGWVILPLCKATLLSTRERANSQSSVTETRSISRSSGTPLAERSAVSISDSLEQTIANSSGVVKPCSDNQATNGLGTPMLTAIASN